MLFSQDIGIDLGTTNTRVYVKNKGIVTRQPSVVAINLAKTPASVVAVGNEAKEMIGRTPGSIVATNPIRFGVVADFDEAVEMVAKFIGKALEKKVFAKARLVICIPSGISEVERRNVHDVAIEAGARYVSLIEEPMAAAIGAKLPVNKAVGSMIVDIGGGLTEVAVVSLGDIVTSHSIRVAGSAIDSAIVSYIRKTYNVLIGDRSAEEIKIKIGSAMQYSGEGRMEIKGRNLLDGLPKAISISALEIREAISPAVDQLVEAVKLCLEKTPPELSADIASNGIMLTGGGAMLRGLDRKISVETGIPVKVAENPMDCVVMGAGKFLEAEGMANV